MARLEADAVAVELLIVLELQLAVEALAFGSDDCTQTRLLEGLCSGMQE